MHYMGMLADSYDNVAWFKIMVEEVTRVNVLQMTDLGIAT